jgi:hypothetical protein
MAGTGGNGLTGVATATGFLYETTVTPGNQHPGRTAGGAPAPLPGRLHWREPPPIIRGPGRGMGNPRRTVSADCGPGIPSPMPLSPRILKTAGDARARRAVRAIGGGRPGRPVAGAIGVGLACVVLALGTTPGRAGSPGSYEPAVVADGGTVVGTVRLVETAAQTSTFLISKDTDVCGGGVRVVPRVRAHGTASPRASPSRPPTRRSPSIRKGASSGPSCRCS